MKPSDKKIINVLILCACAYILIKHNNQKGKDDHDS